MSSGVERFSLTNVSRAPAAGITKREVASVPEQQEVKHTKTKKNPRIFGNPNDGVLTVSNVAAMAMSNTRGKPKHDDNQPNHFAMHPRKPTCQQGSTESISRARRVPRGTNAEQDRRQIDDPADNT